MEFVFLLAMMMILTFGVLFAIKKSDADYAKKHQKTA